MLNEELFWKLQRSLSSEFSKYLLTHLEIDEQIPDNALIVFHIKEQKDFNDWSDKINRAQREPKQPAIVVEVEGIAPSTPPIESRLINPHLEPASF